eukprot:TRINITY_DN12057_c0_g1_i1.p1 TRINITY_DN12057_c0_g1~~TRINITY_DN12057_c0_g1_i1.p1  ORF type:complete len:528 (-),score=52.56 TRINITY_DN12057_c0_g1_i1:91-1674(-)
MSRCPVLADGWTSPRGYGQPLSVFREEWGSSTPRWRPSTSERPRDRCGDSLWEVTIRPDTSGTWRGATRRDNKRIVPVLESEATPRPFVAEKRPPLTEKHARPPWPVVPQNVLTSTLSRGKHKAHYLSVRQSVAVPETQLRVDSSPVASNDFGIVRWNLLPSGETTFPPYPWQPVRVSEHCQTWHAKAPDFHGTYVNTLSLDLDVSGLASSDLSLEQSGFSAVFADSKPRCWLIGDCSVMCKGMLHGKCPQTQDGSNGRNAHVARLPEGMRPNSPLLFAALMRETPSSGGQLVTLVVCPDGWIVGFGRRDLVGFLDLSAIRFCVGPSLLVRDNVRLYVCDLGAKRYVCLQGDLTERTFKYHSSKPLLSLPETCTPLREVFFAVKGSRPGGFSLVSVVPATTSHDRFMGMGADLIWHDSTLTFDHVHFSGVLYEVTPQALTQLGDKWPEDMSKVFLREFQTNLVKRFGSIENAWNEVFDAVGSGGVSLAKFIIGCKAAGFWGNISRLWFLLYDHDRGDVSLAELSRDV